MKIAQIAPRSLLGLAVAGAALLSASGASAQIAATPYYAFTASDLTGLTGGPAYPVADSVDFDALQLVETFADGYSQSLSLSIPGTAAGTVPGAGDIAISPLLMFTPTPNGGYSDLVHGDLTSAVLTGTMAFDGITPDGTGTLSLTVQPTSDPNDTFQQVVYTPFSASLFGPAMPGLAVGTFSLMNLGSSQGTTVNIDAALVPAAVPEASTSLSLGLLLMLSFGGTVIARRKRTAGAAG